MDGFIYSRERIQISFGEYLTINGIKKSICGLVMRKSSITHFCISKILNNFRLFFCRNGDRCFKMALKIQFLAMEMKNRDNIFLVIGKKTVQRSKIVVIGTAWNSFLCISRVITKNLKMLLDENLFLYKDHS